MRRGGLVTRIANGAWFVVLWLSLVVTFTLVGLMVMYATGHWAQTPAHWWS